MQAPVLASERPGNEIMMDFAAARTAMIEGQVRTNDVRLMPVAGDVYLPRVGDYSLSDVAADGLPVSVARAEQEYDRTQQRHADGLGEASSR